MGFTGTFQNYQWSNIVFLTDPVNFSFQGLEVASVCCLQTGIYRAPDEIKGV